MTSFLGGPAKIYMFPARGRFAEAVPQRKDAVVLDAGHSPHVAPVASGDGWYHDEAIRDADLNPKNKPAH